MLLSYVRLVICDLSYVRACDRISVCGSNVSYRICNDSLNLGNLVGRVGLVTGLEIEDLSVNSFIVKTRAENLAA